MTLKRAALAACLAAPLLLGGCTAEKPEGAGVDASFAELMKRPDIEQAEAEYQGLLATIREKLVTDIGIAAWVPSDDEPSAAGCGDKFPGLGADGQTRFYRSGKSPGNLPDADWPRAVSLTAELARQHGFGEPAVNVDRPADHEVILRHPNGAELIFGTANNTTLALSTGCHLTAEAHKRGAPAAEKPLY
ncbi:LppA family lipoprotein [Amycolatopsis nigrescens]|uniref:LppA family lipoprotein n=1 Tax=Amycolatopsis nigrescens TaxID=381445 RepID=UPI00036E98FD|nr:LppA family lipoprotein [Amycolatopsis nigrescens]